MGVPQLLASPSDWPTGRSARTEVGRSGQVMVFGIRTEGDLARLSHLANPVDHSTRRSMPCHITI